MFKPDSYQSIDCPFCSSNGDCKHLFAMYNQSIWDVEGGYLFGKMGVFREEYNQLFKDYIIKFGMTAKFGWINDRYLNYVWEDIISDRDYYNGMISENNFTIPNNIMNYIFELYSIENPPEASESNHGAFASFASLLYYARDCEKEYYILSKLILSNVKELRRKLDF